MVRWIVSAALVFALSAVTPSASRAQSSDISYEQLLKEIKTKKSLKFVVKDDVEGCVRCDEAEAVGAKHGITWKRGIIYQAFMEGDECKSREDGIVVRKGEKGQNNILAEVNAARAARGLRPFVRDALLEQAAEACAAFRAMRRIAGHSHNDFSFVPPGGHAAAAGCAAWPQGMGWGACCTYENWTYAGAAAVIGPDGQRYMHLFVR